MTALRAVVFTESREQSHAFAKYLEESTRLKPRVDPDAKMLWVRGCDQAVLNNFWDRWRREEALNRALKQDLGVEKRG